MHPPWLSTWSLEPLQPTRFYPFMAPALVLPRTLTPWEPYPALPNLPPLIHSPQQPVTSLNPSMAPQHPHPTLTLRSSQTNLTYFLNYKCSRLPNTFSPSFPS